MSFDVPDDYDWGLPPEPEFRRTPVSGRVLCFAPHPDDEVIGAGGALYLHRQQGDPVRVVYATDGIHGDPDGHYEDLRMLRRREAKAGTEVLGVDDLVFWGFPDSHVVTETDLATVAGRVAGAVTEFRPDVVYLPWHEEVHPDHRAVFAGVMRGLQKAAYAGIAYGYEVWRALIPDLVLDVDRVAEHKRRALECHASQLQYVDYRHPVFGLMAHRSMAFCGGKGYCEGYLRYA